MQWLPCMPQGPGQCWAVLGSAGQCWAVLGRAGLCWAASWSIPRRLQDPGHPGRAPLTRRSRSPAAPRSQPAGGGAGHVSSGRPHRPRDRAGAAAGQGGDRWPGGPTAPAAAGGTDRRRAGGPRGPGRSRRRPGDAARGGGAARTRRPGAGHRLPGAPRCQDVERVGPRVRGPGLGPRLRPRAGGWGLGTGVPRRVCAPSRACGRSSAKTAASRQMGARMLWGEGWGLPVVSQAAGRRTVPA